VTPDTGRLTHRVVVKDRPLPVSSSSSTARAWILWTFTESAVWAIGADRTVRKQNQESNHACS
jgi:hypothetical protein